MNKELELWQFVSSRLEKDEAVMLLVVAESSGSSPGRAGYKMAVAAYGDLCGSIGGGVMEVGLVEQARAALSESRSVGIATGVRNGTVIEQVHQKNSPNASGMICSGKQTVIYKLLMPGNAETITTIVAFLTGGTRAELTITSERLDVGPPEGGTQNDGPTFEKLSDAEFTYTEKLGFKNDLYIVGGGHCALALSELMSKMDFRISIYDDRPDLNTIEKNRFAHDIQIIESYDKIGDLIPSGANSYVVVMTLGYRSDAAVIRAVFDKEFKYLGVLGSLAKMKTLIKDLEKEGLSKERLGRIHTPIGLPINSRTPDEIAVSIAAEIISVKNS